MSKIGIINYNIGNLGSIYSALKFYNYDVTFVKTAEEIEQVDFLILAGVGNFSTAMARIRDLDLIHGLNDAVIRHKKPILGICLGMQLFADLGFEDGKTSGFGWINGKVIKMQGDHIKIPHIGWDYVEAKNAQLFQRMKYNCFYFMHSFQFIPDNTAEIAGITHYGPLNIVSVLKKGNIIGVQFHPEKSQGDGLRFLKNVVEAGV